MVKTSIRKKIAPIFLGASIIGLEGCGTEMKSNEPAIKDTSTLSIEEMEEKDITLPYKTSYRNHAPDWAKDDDGDWIVGIMVLLLL